MEIDTQKCSKYAAILDRCDKELDDIYHDYALQHNLSDAALWILYVLYDAKEGMTQADICNCWFFSRQTINTALKSLVQQDVIKLEPIPGNRKSKGIVLTTNGKEMAQRIAGPLKQAENQVFAAFSEEENELLVDLMQKRCSLLRKFLL